jgi:hypothetical protein
VGHNGHPQAWEYTTTFDLVKLRRDVETLNRLGRDGWEAVAMVSSWGLGGGSCMALCDPSRQNAARRRRWVPHARAGSA